MNNGDDIYFSQSYIAQIGGITTSTLSRYLSKSHENDDLNKDNKRKKFSFAEVRNILKHFVSNNVSINKKIQVFFNFKGGTGKTSLCHQVSINLALMGFKVLAIDCDPQAHLSYVLGFDETHDYKTLYDVLINKFPINDVINKSLYDGLDCIPSNLSLTRLELPLSQKLNRERTLAKVLEPLKNIYDFILIDTNPTISTVNQNATLAADILNIVCETQPFSLKGLEMLIQEIDKFSEDMECDINYSIIPNKYESKTATSQEALGTLRHEYKNHVMESLVRKCEDINISAKKKMPVFGFCTKRSMALEDIIDLSHEIIKRSSKKVRYES
ncbi:Chromosome partitioning protein ParA [Candidatus Arcanobacter lacustris]|uniref:Chromosome partitioning protein ParA n=1 Tax=Candidatus Arcanibacter lacustris TaxID=1607817 RepID=A0A0F5MNE5_9RICK|nr:Chromosome partitioning protein ParA [Candidatus Arcanobacter lacustris]